MKSRTLNSVGIVILALSMMFIIGSAAIVFLDHAIYAVKAAH